MRLGENIARGTFCLVFQAIKLSMSKCFLPEKLRATEVGIQNSESKQDAGGPRYAEYRILRCDCESEKWFSEATSELYGDSAGKEARESCCDACQELTGQLYVGSMY